MNYEDYLTERLWPILVETAHALPMYKGHKAYIRDTLLVEKPETTPAELVARLRMPLGEVLVILWEIAAEKPDVAKPTASVIS